MISHTINIGTNNVNNFRFGLLSPLQFRAESRHRSPT